MFSKKDAWNARGTAILGCLVFSAFAPKGAVSAEESDGDCGKVKIVSGSNCKNLVVEFDVNGCESLPEGNSGLFQTAVQCKKGKTLASVKTSAFKYQVQMKKDEGVWGGGDAWSFRGNVQRIRLYKAGAEKMDRKPVVELSESKSEKKEAPARLLKSSGLEFSAYMDMYYSYNFNKPSAVSQISGNSVADASVRPPNNQYRYYDWYNKQVSLALAELTVQYTRQEVKMLVDFDFGANADINASYPSGSSYIADEQTKHIGQAILSYSPSSIKGLVIEGGKLPTHIGYELMKAKDNWNYSRSVGFSYGGPFWHTGVHVGYELVPGRLAASVYGYQGWNTVYESNTAPTLGAQLKWTPSDEFSAIYNFIGGPEQAQNNSNYKQVHELILTQNVTSKFSMALDMVHGSEEGVTIPATGELGTAAWYGLASYFKYAFSERFSSAFRYEVYRDNDGYTLGTRPSSMHTFTLTNAVKFANGLELRLEGRVDHSSDETKFNRRNNSTTSNNQPTVLLGVMYSIAG